MKKYLLLFLFGFFGLLFTQTTYGTVAPIYSSCDRYIRPIIINPNGIDGYKLVSFTGFHGSAEEIKGFSIVTGFIFLIPDDLDFGDIRPIKLDEGPIRWADWEPNSYFRHEENIVWGLDNYGTKFLTRLYDKDDFRCSHHKTFHLIEFYKLGKNDEGDVVLNEIISLPYDKSSIIKYILYFLGFVIVIYGIVYFIKRRKKKYLLLFLFGFLALSFIQIIYGANQIPSSSCHKHICPIIVNSNSIDGYKFVSVPSFSGTAEDVKGFSCTYGFIFLVPENLDVNTIKTIKLADRTRKTDYIDPYHIKLGSLSIRDNPFYGGKSRYGVDFDWGLENEDTVSVGRFVDNSNSLCDYKPSRVIDLYKFGDNGNGVYDLNFFASVPIDNGSIVKYILFFVRGIIVICGIAYFIKRIKAKKVDE